MLITLRLFAVACTVILPGSVDGTEEGKKAGLLSEYHVVSSPARDERDWDLLLVEVYPNPAALDGLDEKSEPMLARLIGAEGKRSKEFIDRGAMRDILGSRMTRELRLK